MGRWVATYNYIDDRGWLLLRKNRYDDKSFGMAGRSRPKGSFHSPLDDWHGTHPELHDYWHSLLYGLPRLLEVRDDPDAVVVSTEGEKDVDTASALGYPAVSHWQGAANSTPNQSRWLKGFRGRLIIVADLDDAGAACALRRLTHACKVVHLPRRQISVVRAADGVTHLKDGVETWEGVDLTDHVEAGGGIDDLVPVDMPAMRAWAAEYTEERAHKAGYRWRP